ncbi:hypothetical protein [Labrys wisconsinensis]|uniref:ABC-type proline/glycine betaine transport system substrate-binding protein n=1 Tax=Labrys wisconsinensis TaxID=425677 RepID=A0ABU0J1I4_9HYPH|nr:hypothetical protein [Labrys wisconsinensis]MDQ0468115.1 ABC-type proline/glycine betaine transport system substrate-binding protein [Labrys wisconsinensis]
MNNVIPFRGRTTAAAVRTSSCPTVAAPVRAQPARRPVLVAVWRPNPISGRPECRWICEPRADDAPSCHIAERRAA